jgi:hypothetical protein
MFGTLDFDVANTPVQVNGERKVRVEFMPPFAGESLELSEFWKDRSLNFNLCQFIVGKVDAIRDGRETFDLFVSLLTETVLTSLGNIPATRLNQFLMGLTVANPFSRPENHRFSRLLLVSMLQQIAGRKNQQLADNIAGFCCDRCVDGVFNDCPGTVLSQLIPLAIWNHKKLILAFDSILGFLAEAAPSAIQEGKRVIHEMNLCFNQIHSILNDQLRLLLVRITFLFAASSGDECRKLREQLLQSAKSPQSEKIPQSEEEVSSKIAGVLMASRDRMTSIREANSPAIQNVRKQLREQAVIFCDNQSVLLTKYCWSYWTRGVLTKKVAQIESDLFEGLLEKLGLFPFARRPYQSDQRETVFRVVYECSTWQVNKVKVEVCGLVGDCLMFSKINDVLLVHSFNESNAPFEIVFDEVGGNREQFNGHAVFRFRREELKETDRCFLLKCGPSLSISILRTEAPFIAVRQMVRPRKGTDTFQ